MKGRSVLSLKEFSSEEVRYILEVAEDFKHHRETYMRQAPLNGKTLILLFQKRSTRTRVTAEIAMRNLGGESLFLGNDEIHLGINESIRDTALFLGRMASALLVRVYDHQDLETIAKFAGIPVINALSDKYHPLQGLADVFTIQKHFGTLMNLKVAWIGDGNNVCHSLMIGCAKLGLEMQIASPSGYEPLEDMLKYCQKITSSKITVTSEPEQAVKDANVVVTDTIISMGQEAQREEKLRHFQGFQVNSELLKNADPNYIFMHCLPRHEEEVTDEIFYGPHSVVFDEAENRLYTIASIFYNILC